MLQVHYTQGASWKSAGHPVPGWCGGRQGEPGLTSLDPASQGLFPRGSTVLGVEDLQPTDRSMLRLWGMLLPLCWGAELRLAGRWGR